MLDLEQIQTESSRCYRCGKTVLGFPVARYEHDDCEEPKVDEARLREARRVLYANTAALLHKMGHHAEAAWHEGRARR